MKGQKNKSVETLLKIDFNKEEKVNQLVKVLKSPWKLIKEGGKLGIKGVTRFFRIIALFAFTNALLFFYTVYKLSSSEFEYNKLGFAFIVFLIGLIFTVYAGYRTYQFVLIDTIKVIYDNLSSVFQKISEQLVDEVEKLFNGKVDLSDNQITKAIDFGKMINNRYQNLPKFLRKGIVLVLNRVPYVGMILSLKEEILGGDKVKASTKLYNQMDGYISDSIFGNNNTNWVRWLLPLNIIIILVLIFLKIS